MLRLLSAIALMAVVARPCAAEIRSVAEIREFQGLPHTAERSLSLGGLVTLADPARNLFVVQDDTGAAALHPDEAVAGLEPGRRITLTAAGCSPFVANCPGFPFAPAHREIRNSFEIPEHEGEFRLTRMRGWLRAPATGDYTFWIASDDSSELWLGESDDPESARRVALVPSGQWTGSREWSRFAAQRSEPVRLHAGVSYYIEALHEQALAGSHLAVAWEGPGQEQAVIDGAHLAPWSPEGKAEAGGILREYWNDYAMAKVGLAATGGQDGAELSLRKMKHTLAEDGAWPQPRPIDPVAGLQPDDAWRWVELAGEVRFIAADGAGATFEIASGEWRFPLRVARWQGPLPQPGKRWQARFCGVCETGRDTQGRLVVAAVWTPSERYVSISEAMAESSPDETSPAESSPADLLGGSYFTRGVVTFSGEVFGKPCLVVQEALGGIFVDFENGQPHPPLQVGQSVEVNGHLVPRTLAPALRPLSLNILGWLSPPPLETPAAEKDYRHGLWTEVEGVVRGVDADGTLRLMGKLSPVAVWLGGAGRGQLDALVDSTLCVRGVMSLEGHAAPLLLVPSRRFVEVREAAPALPAVATSVANLRETVAGTGWRHRSKIEGTVTYQNDRFFFVQDGSGAVRVLAGGGAEPGTTVSVTGFPDPEGGGLQMSGATWQPLEAAPADAQPGSAVRHGELVKLDAHLISLTRRDGGLDLELQAGPQVVEAVLDEAAAAVPALEPGSLLEITGVGRADASGRPRVLLRAPRDIVLLEGPPWWTWQRAAWLIGALMAVLAGSLLRIHFLHRRFERQQAARLAFSRGMLESQESERRRIAASLHDGLGQELLVIRNQAHLAIQSAPEPLRQRLEEISGTTLQAINEVREITRNLRPYQLDRLGLTQSIRALVRKVAETCPVEFACHVDEVDGLFDGGAEIHLYRIVQEGLNNVLKHSGATEAAVVVKRTADGLSISVRDNGRGLPNAASPGFGLSGITERAEILGGTARMESAPGQGVHLQVLLPIPAPCETASKS